MDNMIKKIHFDEECIIKVEDMMKYINKIHT